MMKLDTMGCFLVKFEGSLRVGKMKWVEAGEDRTLCLIFRDAFHLFRF